MRCVGIPFHLVFVNVNVDNELWEGLNLTVPRLVQRRSGVGVGGRPGLVVKVK